MFVFTIQGMPLCAASPKGPVLIGVDNKDKAVEMVEDLKFVLGDGVGFRELKTKPVEQENTQDNSTVLPGAGKTLSNMTHNPEFD